MNDTPPGKAPAHPDDELMEAVLHDLVPAEDVSRFTAHLRDCESCERRFQDHAARFERLRTRPVPVRDPVEGLVLPDAGTDGGSLRGARRRWGPVLVGAAALAAVLMVVLRPPGSLPQRWLPPGSGEVIVRSLATGDSALSDGLLAYDARDAERAARILSSVTAGSGREAFHRLYTASALVLVGNWPEAQRILDSMSPGDLPEPWRGEADWLRYRVYLATDRTDDATRVLSALRLRDDDLGQWVRSLDLP